jgi:hypothetical protein
MKIIKHTALVFTSLLLAGLESASAGQALFAPIKFFYDSAALVVIVEVKKVTKVEVSTGAAGQTSEVYVAEAEVLQTLKSDHTPTPEKRKIAVVGSTIPRSSAAMRPIETRRYLAFLNPEQGHYHFKEMYAMRPISPEGKVEWLEKNAKGVYELTSINVEDAIKKIQSEQDGGGQPATRPESK